MQGKLPSRKPSKADSVFSTGKRFNGQYVALYIGECHQNCCGTIFCVAKKIFRTKPQRNYLKRLLRASFQSCSISLDRFKVSLALMMISRPPNFVVLEADLQKVFTTALSWIERKSSKVQ